MRVERVQAGSENVRHPAFVANAAICDSRTVSLARFVSHVPHRETVRQNAIFGFNPLMTSNELFRQEILQCHSSSGLSAVYAWTGRLVPEIGPHPVAGSAIVSIFPRRVECPGKTRSFIGIGKLPPYVLRGGKRK
jgi:hypothetical protein